MKNTMKKLLCMALAIMLLVSAVPVFAAATEVTTANYELYLNGSLSSGTYDVGTGGMTGIQILGGLNPNYLIDYQLGAFYINGTPVNGDAKVYGGQTIRMEVNDKPAPAPVAVAVYLVLKNVEKTITTTEGADVTLTESLVRSKNFNMPENSTVKHFVNMITGDIVPVGTTVKAANGLKFEVVLQTATSNGNNNSGGTGSDNQAPATSNKNVTLNIVNVSGGSVVWTKTDSLSGDSTTVKNLLYYWYGGKSNSWQNSYDCTKAWSKAQKKDVGYEGTIAAGDTVTVVLSPKNNNNNNNNNSNNNNTNGNLNLVITANGAVIKQEIVQNFGQDTVYNLIRSKLNDANWTDKYGFNEVVINGVTYYRTDLVVKGGDTVNISLARKFSKDNSNKVYLHVYLNGDASTIVMTKDITGTYLMDDWKTDTNEILNYLKNNYYSAKDSSNAITIDGLYVSTDSNGTFPSKYYADNKVASKDRINELLEDGFVHISVMLKNAKAKSSATADTSNPKTGDTIFVPVMVMGLTASALAAAYVFGKKRIAR